MPVIEGIYEEYNASGLVVSGIDITSQGYYSGCCRNGKKTPAFISNTIRRIGADKRPIPDVWYSNQLL